MRTKPEASHRIPDRFKTQEICKKAVDVDHSFLQLVPDHFKTPEMCDDAVWETLSLSGLSLIGLYRKSK